MLQLLAYVLGFFAAIPIGATQIEIAKRAIANEVGAALMVVAGSVVSDVMYGVIALFGLATFLRHRTIEGWFGLAGAIVLLVLAWFTFRNAARASNVDLPQSPALRSRGLSFTAGFTLAVTNPPIMFWWLVGAKLARDLGIVESFTASQSAVFILFGGLGLASYLTTLTFVLRRIHHMIGPGMQQRIHRIMGVVLVALAAYMLIRAALDLGL